MDLIETWKKRPPPYEIFFTKVQMLLAPEEEEGVKFGYFVSKYGHTGQSRDDGTRYFDHPKGAAWIFIDELGGRDSRVIIVLLIHDISEDTYLLSPRRTKINFGEEVALDLAAVTKLPKGKDGTPKETAEEYLARIVAQGPRAILAKLIDRLHNLRTLYGCPETKRIAQMEETQKYHLPILIPALAACGGEYAEYAELLKEKILEAIKAYTAD